MSGTQISAMTPLAVLPETGAVVPVVKAGEATNYAYDIAAKTTQQDQTAQELQVGLSSATTEIAKKAYVWKTLSELQDANVASGIVLYDGYAWVWDPAAVANGKDRIASNNSATGAWVQQSVTVDVSNAAFAGGARPSNTAAQNTAAFAAVGAFVSAIGGATIVIPRGTYQVGKQTFAGATGKGYAYRSEPILYINGCTRPIVIEGNGATLRFADGLKMGSFDPVTGNAFTPTLPFTNRDYRADVGVMIQVYNSNSVTIRDLELDGNLQKHIMGGKWGDLDYQCYSTGIEGYSNLSTTIQNVNAHHCGLDGLMIGDPGLTVNQAARPVVISASTFLYNGRQGLSWIGGNSLTAIGCKFSYTGRAVNDSLGGPLFSAPGAGIDFEAEASVVRNGVFINCEIFDNAGPGLLAEAGDVRDIRFTNCVTIGTTNWSTWFNKPGLIYGGGSIRGALVNQYASDYPSEATQFRGVLFSDESFASLTPYVSGGISMFFTQLGQQVIYDGCTFVATRGKIGRLDYANITNYRIDWRVPSSIVPDTDYAALFWSAKLGTGEITVNNTVAGVGHYFGINSATSFAGRNFITIVAGNARWVTPTAGAGGYVGDFGQRVIGAIGSPSQGIFKQMAATGRFGAIYTYANSSAPANGALPQGSVVLNENADNGSPASWVVNAAGVGRPTGIVGAVPATGLTSSSTAAQIVAALQAAGLAS